MLITCRIWFWQFIEVWVWFTGGHKLSALKQERHRIRLRKEKEKEMVDQQKEGVDNWKDMIILYRMITSRFAKTMLMW